jgi:pilus assembly protein CpaC
VRAKSGSIFAYFSAMFIVVCVVPVLSAQTSKPPAPPVAPVPTPVAPASTMEIAGLDSAEDLSVEVGKSVLVDFTRPVQKVAVGLSEIAEARPISPTEIMLNGKTPGQTSLIIWEKGGDRQFFNVTVRRNTYESNDRLNAIRRELSIELPGQSVTVSSENGSIFLRGNVKDLESSNRAAAIAETALAPISNADVTGKSGQGAGGGGGSAGKVINLLYVDVPPAEKQILLKVRFASVDRNKSKSLGFNFYSLGLGNTVGGITTGQFTPPMVNAATTGSTTIANGIETILPAAPPEATFSNELNILAMVPGGLPMGVDIEALESEGVAQVLAEPNLLAANGHEASFLAGGEYPFPVAQSGTAGGGSTISIQWKEYGVRLNFIPTITPRGTIRLQVSPEVSALDFADAVEVGGSEVPALTIRRVKDEVELGDGQSFVIGGLLNNTETETFQKVPFLGDIPILGKFFQSQSKTRANTELIVIVTPEIVDPIPAGANLPKLKYPSKFLPPNSGIPMYNPDGKPAGETPTPPPATLPVEKLIESQKPETPLVIETSVK